MTNMFDALEFCLREVEEGGDIETALARFPEYRDELRPILETSVKARALTVPEPAPDVVRRSRARVMQRAAELREVKVAPRKRGIPLLQRLAISFALAAVFLLSGNGLLSASASALPGERLYPVKRGWESMRLFFIFDAEARELLANQFENERLHEANELLADGRHEVIEFAGVFMQVNGLTYISGLQVILPPGMTLPENGDAVIVSGRTNAEGFVELISLELLPAGSVVPSGSPIEVEIESESGESGDSAPVAESASKSGSDAIATKRVEYEVKGTLESISTDKLVINGLSAYLKDTKIQGKLCVGARVEVKGYYAGDGRFMALEVESESACVSSSGSSSGGNDNGVDASGSGGGSNSNDDSNENETDDEGGNSGKGGGDDDD